jgi:hypothetical protein
MKDVLTVITFVVGALCFLMFLNVFKSDARGVVNSLPNPAHCEMPASAAPGCRTESEGLER